MAPRILWIGLGNIGRGMCKNLVEKGSLDKPLLVYNRTVKRATDLGNSLPAGKTEVAESLNIGISKADIIFSCLANDQAVRETYATAVQGDIRGKVFVDCSTIAPGVTEEIAKTVLDHGAEFVCGPIFGAPAVVAAGKAIFVLAGPKASTARVRPYTSIIGGGEIDMSDEPYGRGSTLKLLGNTVILGMVEQLSQTCTVAEKSGLGTDYVQKFVEALFPGTPYIGYFHRMLSGDYYKREEPLCCVDLARKDVKHALAIAKDAGAQLQMIEIADKHLQAVQKHAGRSGDIAGVYGAVRQEAGLKFEN